MNQPFDIELNDINYAIFPEGDHVYMVFKDGKEYIQIQKDAAQQWIKFDRETALPIFELDTEVNALGQLIDAYLANPPLEDDDLD